MSIVIKQMETDEEIKGKAFVHWKAWHEAYPGLVSKAYLDSLNLLKCEMIAYRWIDNIFVAKNDGKVIGFLGYGVTEEGSSARGEIFALYVLSEYYGTGAGKMLMDAGLEQLKKYARVCLWVLKENKRAIRFYEKCGFFKDGTEKEEPALEAVAIRMTLER